MADKHPAYDKIARFVAERDAAQLRARMAAQLAQLADAKLSAALKDAGFDPEGVYRMDDEKGTIELDAPRGTTP